MKGSMDNLKEWIIIMIDYAFKIIFGRVGNECILKDLLNSVIYTKEEEKITEIHYLNPYGEKLFKNDKQIISDIKFRDEKGRLYTVEMQMYADPYYLNRGIFYSAKLLVSTMKEGMKYDKVECVTGIHLIEKMAQSQNLFKDGKYHTELKIQEKDDTIFSDIMVWHLINLGMFKDIKGIPTDRAYKWLYFIANSKDINPYDPPEEYKNDPM